MRKIITCILTYSLLLVFTNCSNSSKEFDTRAIAELDKLSETISSLNSCSYTLNVYKSIIENDTLKELKNIENDTYIVAPNKMYIYSNGIDSEKSYWYNGKQLAYYSFDKNVYATTEATGNIIEAIDFIHNKFDIDFPAADFFYPSLTDDIMENYNTVYYSEEDINGVKCFAIQASNDDETLNIWIEKETSLPYKMEISNNKTNKVYECVFSNWRINPKIGDEIFNFQPPSNSTQIQLKTKN